MSPVSPTTVPALTGPIPDTSVTEVPDARTAAASFFFVSASWVPRRRRSPGNANRVHHPLNVTLRQDAVLPPLEDWLARKFGPRYLAATIDELAAAAIQADAPDDSDRERQAKIADCDRKLASYRAALDAGASPFTVAAWITETEAERARYKAMRRPETPRPAITRDDIAAHITRLADVLGVLRDADPRISPTSRPS